MYFKFNNKSRIQILYVYFDILECFLKLLFIINETLTQVGTASAYKRDGYGFDSHSGE